MDAELLPCDNNLNPRIVEAVMRMTVAYLPVALGLVLCGMAQAQTPQKEAGSRDFTPYAEFAELLPPRVQPHKDDKTGFVIGGKNPTELIAKLSEINGRSIAQLETDMRPKKLSSAGFLGPEEKLLDVLAADNRYVVDEMGLSHQELARHLHALAAIGDWLALHDKAGDEFVYHGKRFKALVEHARWSAKSPFDDGTKSGSNATVTNTETGKRMRYGLLVPYMVERYGFYEGKGTPYRLEPQTVVDVLGFLKKKRVMDPRGSLRSSRGLERRSERGDDRVGHFRGGRGTAEVTRTGLSGAEHRLHGAEDASGGVLLTHGVEQVDRR